jgi:ATP-dependent Lon protease
LDKACSKNGSNEISSILIHLTDPNMNKSFQDRFFQGVDFPLDKVIMIFSYNDSSLIDPILLDRIQEISVDAYTPEQKMQLVNQFVLPELKNISKKFIHKPWELKDEKDFKLGRDYPFPLVKHEEARAKALSAFKKI